MLFESITAEKEGPLYTFLHNSNVRRLAVEQLPVFLISLTLAEFFFKFHSFTLECFAFLATWYVMDLAFAMVRRRLSQIYRPPIA